MHLGALTGRAARNWPDRPALVFGKRRWSFTELHEEVERVSAALIASGVQRGDRVAVWMVNRPEWVFAQFAIARVGAVIVPLNTRYRADDVAYVLAQSKANLLLTHARSGPVDYLALLDASMPELREVRSSALELARYPALGRIVIVDTDDRPALTQWSDWLAGGAEVSPEAVAARFSETNESDHMMVMYTSGTTGSPKGAVHAHAPVRNAMERMAIYGIDHRDTQMSYLPLFHVYGFSEVVMGSVAVGARQVMMETFDADLALDIAERERATVLHGFDAHWLDLLRAQGTRPRQLAVRLATCPSGMASSVVTARRVEETFATTLSGWGMSESWAFVACSSPSDTLEQRTEASGSAMPGYEFRVIDPDTGEDLPPDTPGELLTRGYALMRGYFDRPEATGEVIDADGWLHTGDMCRLRPDGHVVFMGRYRDVLKVGGENVSPAEVEALLLGIDGVLDAAVVGVEDERLQEVPVAFVLVAATDGWTADAVVARMRGRVASFKLPQAVFFETVLPMTPSGKVRKVELRAMARERLAGRA